MRRHLKKLDTPFGGLLVLALGAGAIMGAEVMIERDWREGSLAGAAAPVMTLLGGAALVLLPVWLFWAVPLVLGGAADLTQRGVRFLRRPPAPAAPPPRRATTVHARLLTPDVPPVRSAPPSRPPPASPRPRPASAADKPRSPGSAVELAIRCFERGHAYPTQPRGQGDRGYVYVFANPSIPGAFKIGQTNRDPLQRARELHTTAVPFPFLCVYSRPSFAPRRVEVLAHRSLRASRLSSSREFFASDLRTVVAAVEEAAGLVERTARRA